jgi:hypothetical protein
MACAITVALACACAASGEDGGPALPDSSTARGDASMDATGPSPDAIVFVVDSAVPDEAAADVTPDVPLVGKTCQGLPDGTPCGPAPNECVNDSLCSQGTCAAPVAKGDGTACGGTPDVCHNQSTCAGGPCSPQAKPDGTVCAAAPDACHTAATCSGGTCGAVGTQPDGTNWNTSDTSAICCSGNEVENSSNDNCGACGITCNAINGESCQALDGIYFCRGCMSSSGCWSQCCSESFTPNSCAASDCAGNCSAEYCPSGTHCVEGAPNASDYCAY